MVSIKDIAKKAGVSISTVSYALNGNPKITEETAEKIRRIAKELNYVPHAGARSLKKRESNIIGVFLTNYSGVFYGHLLQGISETLSKNGYDMIVCSGKRSHRFIPERRIDGAIVLDATFSTDELKEYAEKGHKIVVLDRELSHPNIGQVLLDNKAGSTLAIDYLIEKGHRNIYLVTGPKDNYDSMQRTEAVIQAVNHYKNMYPIEFFVIEGDFNKESGIRAAKQIIENYKEPVSVFCLNDEMAIGMYDYLQSTPYKVGEHVHIIGFDNIELSSYTTPRLSTIEYSKRKWGSLAAELLLNLIQDKPVKKETIYVTLIHGESVGQV